VRLILFLVSVVTIANAQQPFLTDDADVPQLRSFHLEIVTEHDLLQRGAYPTLRQNTTRLQLTYGLLDSLEIGLDGPLLSIYNARQSGTPDAFGVGDLDLQMKYRVRSENENSSWPAFALALAIELPTGNPRNQLGSGIADYWLNGIVQKTLTSRTTLRANSGILFSGNTLTGAIGIRSVRGVVFTAASSLTYKLSERWLVGGELAGALTQQFDLGKGQLQAQLGGKYALRRAISLDFAVTSGKFEGSPRLGGAFGISVDF
jgi:hypothetical protein